MSTVEKKQEIPNEERFVLIGNVGLGIEFLSRLTSISLGKKKSPRKNLKIIKSFNKRIKDGYSGSIGDLISECFSVNHLKVNPQLIIELEKDTIQSHTQYKVDSIQELVTHIVDNRFKNIDNKHAIKNKILEAIKFSLLQTEKVDMKLIRDFISEEKKNELADEKKSQISACNYEEIEKIIYDFSNSEHSTFINKSFIQAMTEESKKIGKGWIRKLLKVSKYPEFLTLFQYNEIENFLYWNSGNELENRVVIDGVEGKSSSIRKKYRSYSSKKESGNENLSYKGIVFGESSIEKAKSIITELRLKECEAVPKNYDSKRQFRGRVLDTDGCVRLTDEKQENVCNALLEMPGANPEETGAIFVVEEMSKSGKVKRVVAQSWVWRNLGRVCFDNIKIQDEFLAELKDKDGFDSLLDLFKLSAIGMIAVDELALKKIVEIGEITAEDAQKIKISEVTLGNGCKQLLNNISGSKRKELKVASPVLPYEAEESGSIPAKKMANSSDYYNQWILLDDISLKPSKIDKYLSVTGLGIKYTKIREVKKYTNEDISEEIIDSIKELNQKEKIQKGFFTDSSIDNYLDIAETLGIEEGKTQISVSMSKDCDWYILSKEDEKSITIEDSLVARHFDKQNPKSKSDKIMSLNEYSMELLSIIYSGYAKDKRVKLNPEREGRFGILECLVEKEIIDITNLMITMKDVDMLKSVINGLKKELEVQKRDRIIADISYVRSDEER